MSTSQEAAWQCSAAGKVTAGLALHHIHYRLCGISMGSRAYTPAEGQHSFLKYLPSWGQSMSMLQAQRWSAAQSVSVGVTEHANNPEKQYYVRLSTKCIICTSFLCSKIPVNVHRRVYHLICRLPSNTWPWVMSESSPSVSSSTCLEEKLLR